MSTTGDGKEDAPRPDGGVEPETVTGCGVWIKGGKCGEDGLCGTCWAKREGVHVPTLRANLRLVEEELRQAREERDNWKERAGANDQDREDESQLRAEAEANWQRESALLRRAEADRDRLAEELRQAREVAHSRLRDRARLVRRAERAEADLDLLTRRFALVADRSGVRAQALQLAQECITENVANGEGVDSQPAVLDAIFDALKYEIADEPDDARPGAKPPIQSTDALSPVQGEHEQDGEDDRQAAIDEALRAMRNSEYVNGGITEREAWQTVWRVLGPFETHLKMAGPAQDGDTEETT